MSKSNTIRIIYLDWNIIVHLINGDYPELLKAINSAKLDRQFIVPFTSVHVEEATNIRSESEKKLRLEFLSKLSNNIYFENEVEVYREKKSIFTCDYFFIRFQFNCKFIFNDADGCGGSVPARLFKQ